MRFARPGTADRPASCGNQTVCFTRPRCWIQVLTVDVIYIAADHQMFMTLIGELSWLRLRRSAVDWLKKRKNRSSSHPFWTYRITYALHLWLIGKPMVGFIFTVIELFSLSPTIETLWAEIGCSLHFSKGGGSLWAQIWEGRGHRPPTIVGVRKLEWLPFRVVSKYVQSII